MSNINFCILGVEINFISDILIIDTEGKAKKMKNKYCYTSGKEKYYFTAEEKEIIDEIMLGIKTGKQSHNELVFNYQRNCELDYEEGTMSEDLFEYLYFTLNMMYEE